MIFYARTLFGHTKGGVVASFAVSVVDSYTVHSMLGSLSFSESTSCNEG